MHSFLANTLALLVFFTNTGVLNERSVAGMYWGEVAAARGIGAPLMVLTAHPTTCSATGCWDGSQEQAKAHGSSGTR